MRALIALVVVTGCGETFEPPAVNIILDTDTSHACAGAVSMKVTLAEVNGPSTETELAAAVAPQQIDCDFSVGVAEALYGTAVGDIETGRPYTVAVELHDSTGHRVAAGQSEPFQAKPDDTIEPVRVQVTRTAPLGTALLDLMREPQFAAAGTLDLDIDQGIGTTTRQLTWPGDDSLKRPLRVSGLVGFVTITIRLHSSGATLADFVTETFAAGTTVNDAISTPSMSPR